MKRRIRALVPLLLIVGSDSRLDAAVDIVATKCVDDGFGACSEEPLLIEHGRLVQYLVAFDNVGVESVFDPVIIDEVPLACGGINSVVSGSEQCLYDVLLCPGVSACNVVNPAPSMVMEVVGEMAPGCIVRARVDVITSPTSIDTCCNTAEMQWSSPAVGRMRTPESCFTTTYDGNYAVTKTRTTSGTVAPGGTVTFDINVRNLGDASPSGLTIRDDLASCFEPVGALLSPCPTGPTPPSIGCAGVACAGAFCTVDSSHRFRYGNVFLAAYDGQPGGDDELTITVSLLAGPTEGRCENSVEVRRSVPIDADSDDVLIVSGSVVDLDLTHRRLSAPIVAPGATVRFSTRVENVGDLAHSSGLLGNTIPDCLAAIGSDGAPCPTGPAPPAVQCSGSGCIGATCTVTNQGRGYQLSGFSLAASDLAPGGADELVMSLELLAGDATGPCSDLAGLLDPADGIVTGSASVEILGPCDLAREVVSPPIVRAPPWVYTNSCPVADPRLPATNLVVPSIAPGGAMDTVDAVSAGVDGELYLYQLDCPCAGEILLTKNAVSGRVRAHLVP